MEFVEKNNTLYLFTAGFPYGTRNEPFLETEILYLSKRFKEILIFPRIKEPTMRAIPSNVQVVDFYCNIQTPNKVRVLVRNLSFLSRVLLNSKLNPKFIINFIKHYRVHLDLLATGINEGEKLVELSKKFELKENDVIYDYWFMNSIISIDYWRSKSKWKNKIVCRTHRYDLYPENWKMINVPFTFYRLHAVQQLVFISKHGLNYLKRITRPIYHSKFELSYLGVNPPSAPNFQEEKDFFRIVSCARVVDFKNIHNIPKVLAELNIPIEWVHFGDGPMLNELEKNIQQLPSNSKVVLKGHQSNTEVLSYYKNHSVDAFFSISDSEGLPVSMMEAQSFGIPIIAKDAGGISEIVNENTGLLLQSDSSWIEIANAIQEFLSSNEIQKESILKFYNDHFNASLNYKLFAEQL